MDQVTTEFGEGSASQEAGPESLDHLDEPLSARANSSSILPKSRRDPRTHKNREWLVKKILVPVDYSPGSTKAIRRAVALANQCDAALTLLYVVDVNAQGETGSAEEMMRGLWSEGSAKMALLACSLSGQVNAQTLLEEGLPGEVIAQKSCEFDLVVMAKSHARRRWKLFSQHTAQRVIETAACPVMLVDERT